MREVIRAFIGWEALEQTTDHVPKRRDGAASGGAQHRLQFGEHLFDRIEVGAVWREIEQLRAHPLDGLAHACDPVGRKVVHDDHIPPVQRRREELLHVSEEGSSVHGAIQHQWRGQTILTEGGHKSRGLPMMGWTPPDGISVPGWCCREPPEGGVHGGSYDSWLGSG